MHESVLEVKNLSKQFGGVAAVQKVNLAISSGGVHAIIGPNGAGKTTLFHLIAGTIRSSGGRVVFEGRDVTTASEPARAKLGLVRSFQKTNVFGRMSVVDNVLLAVVQKRRLGKFSLFREPTGLDEARERAQEILEVVGLAHLANQKAQSLPHGDQRILDVAVALACEPKLLLLDEPASGLSSGEAERIGELIGELGKRFSVLLIEHNVDLVMALARQLTVLSFGEVIATGTPDEIADNRQVQEAYFGVVA